MQNSRHCDFAIIVTGMKRVRKFFGLSACDRTLLLRTAVVLIVVRVSLWLAPFRSILRVLPRLRGSRACASADRLMWSVCCAARFVPYATCLVQALALHILMSGAGYGSCVRIGCASGDGKPEAHAWLEAGGQVLLGGPDIERYNQLLVIGAARQ